jgi:hypothetical protein
MFQTIRRLSPWLLVLALTVLLAGSAGAEGPRKDFMGLVQKISKKELLVDNRMGDKLKFKPAKQVPVSGEGREKWDDIKKGDWVVVTWEMFDKPRVAYEVKVVPPKAEAGEDL